MSDTTNAATEVVAEVAEEVAEQATQLAQVSRGMSGRDLGLVFGGIIVGTGLGGVVTYILSNKRLETKWMDIAQDEVETMRRHYAAKVVAHEAQVGKAELSDIVRERGYSTGEDDQRPMAIEPPRAVVEAAQESSETEDEEEPAEPEVFSVFQDSPPEDTWDDHKERATRSPLAPYVIHIDEREENDAYDAVTYTYYAEDDVLCREDDSVIDEDDRHRLVGEANLEKFGHGSGDRNAVYIRNDQLEMDIEVIRSPNAFATEVHGLQHADVPRRSGRPRFDDD